MRKYDRNAVFNIAVKALLFIAFFTAVFCILKFAFNLATVISVIVGLICGLAAVFLFSYLLRYTGFTIATMLLFPGSCSGKSREMFTVLAAASISNILKTRDSTMT